MAEGLHVRRLMLARRWCTQMCQQRLLSQLVPRKDCQLIWRILLRAHHGVAEQNRPHYDIY